MLNFGARPPFDFKRFIGICRGLMPDAEIEMLEAIPGGYVAREQPTFRKWRAFDAALRNELVKIRASRKHLDPLKYMRPDGFIEPRIIHIAMNAHRSASLLEAEKMLDQERWQMLEELSAGHYFDIDFLVIYAQKLLILERWERIRSADKQRLLAEALTERA